MALAVLLALLGAVLPAYVAATAQDAPTGSATFGDLSATPTFPGTIDFRLTAEAPSEIVRAELLYTPRWEETLNLIEADITPGRQLDLTFPLDMFQNYLPPGLDIIYRWRLTDAEGAVTESPEQTVLWMDTRFAWQEIATDQVSVFFYTGDEAFNRRILDSAQRTVDELQTGFGVERSRPIRIWVYDSKDDFGGANEPNSEAWIAGVSFPGRYLILAVIPDGNQTEIDRVIPHEISHQVLYQATENPFNLPATWLDEGLAVYHQEADTDGYAQILDDAVRSGDLFPLTSLTSAFPFDETYRLAYAEGMSVVEFIIAEWGEEALGQVIAAYRDGVSHDEAIRRGIGLTLAELDARWKASLGYAGDRPLDDGTGGSIRTISPDDDEPLDPTGAALGIVTIAALAVAYVRRRRPNPANAGIAA